MAHSSRMLGSVLVFGGCGFLGHHIAKQASLAPDVTKVTVFDIDTSKNRIPGVEYITGSILEKDDVDYVFHSAQPTVVFHTVSPDPFSRDNKLFFSVNVDGTKNILSSAQKSDCTKALVYTSSSSVTHNHRGDIVNATEEARILYGKDQPEFYSHTKAIAEILVLAANNNAIRTVAIRPAALFGPGDTITTTNSISNARQGRGRLQIGDNSNFFDFTYVENTVYAQLLAARAVLHSYTTRTPPDDERVDGEAFIITNDEPWRFWAFLRAMAAAAGYPTDEAKVIAVPGWVMLIVALMLEWAFLVVTLGRKEPKLSRKAVKYTTMQRTFDISKAKKRLGYRPQVSMQEGIERSAKWFVESRH